MTRVEWQQIAEARLFAAQALLAEPHWASAYYLAGYAIECGLKSCVIARVFREPELIFAEKKFSENCWTHDLVKLVQLAGLDIEFAQTTNDDALFEGNWLTVKKWHEGSRYEHRSQVDSESFVRAIDDSKSGVFAWIKRYW